MYYISFCFISHLWLGSKQEAFAILISVLVWFCFVNVLVTPWAKSWNIQASLSVERFQQAVRMWSVSESFVFSQRDALPPFFFITFFVCFSPKNYTSKCAATFYEVSWKLQINLYMFYVLQTNLISWMQENECIDPHNDFASQFPSWFLKPIQSSFSSAESAAEHNMQTKAKRLHSRSSSRSSHPRPRCSTPLRRVVSEARNTRCVRMENGECWCLKMKYIGPEANLTC